MLTLLHHTTEVHPCQFSLLEPLLQEPFPQTPEDLLQLEQRLITAAGQAADQIVLVQLTRAHEDEAFVRQAIALVRAQSPVPLVHKGYRTTNVLLLGGTCIVLETPYLRQDRRSRRGRRRRTRGPHGTGFRGGSASGGGGSWSGHGAYGGSASGGGGSWSGTGARGGTAAGRWGLLARDRRLWHDGVSLVGICHDGVSHDNLWYDGLLRRHLRGVPSADHRELLWLLVRQLRGLVHRLRRRCRCRGRRGRRGGRGLGQHRRRHLECLLSRLRCWRDHHRVCHGRDLCDAPDWLRRLHSRRDDLLPLQHNVVPAVLRCERRLLPRGAYAMRARAPVPLAPPASGKDRLDHPVSHQCQRTRGALATRKLCRVGRPLPAAFRMLGRRPTYTKGGA